MSRTADPDDVSNMRCLPSEASSELCHRKIAKPPIRGFRWRQDCIFVNGDTCGDSCRQPAGKYLFYESIDQDWACRLWRIRRYAVDGAAPAEKPLDPSRGERATAPAPRYPHLQRGIMDSQCSPCKSIQMNHSPLTWRQNAGLRASNACTRPHRSW